ncbi:MAG: tRNA (adenosine(37)-N6)-threonylcarbamoyltransferase complex dimerization subunit type 1 TsaB [Anaerolineae bacterium]
MLLAIDTATRLAGLALYDQVRGRFLGEEAWYSADSHTVELTPRLVRMLDQQGLAPADLDGLVVSLGPGSYTGLRIGLSVAKGLALSLALPLVGVPTLDVVAEPHKEQRLPICALLQAGRRRFCAGHYYRYRGRWRRRGVFQLATLEEICDQLVEPTLFCGEIEAGHAERIRERLGTDAVVAQPAASLRRAGYLAELGWQRLSRGDADDANQLSPIYLRQP